MQQLLRSSITYRIAVGPQQDRKVVTLQRLPASDEPLDNGVGGVFGSSCTRAWRRERMTARRQKHCPLLHRIEIDSEKVGLSDLHSKEQTMALNMMEQCECPVFDTIEAQDAFMAKLARVTAGRQRDGSDVVAP